MTKETVNHPDHYNVGGIECLAAIEAAMTKEEFIGFLKGNAMKYLWRHRHKGGVKDVEKAVFYMNMMVERLKAEPVVEKLPGQPITLSPLPVPAHPASPFPGRIVNPTVVSPIEDWRQRIMTNPPPTYLGDGWGPLTPRVGEMVQSSEVGGVAY